MSIMVNVLQEYNTRSVVAQLSSFPDELKAQKPIVRRLREVYEAAKIELELREAEIVGDIASDVFRETGKPRFSNETARKAELMKRAATDMEYRAKARDARDAENEYLAAQDELEALFDRFKAAQFVAKIISAEIACLSSDVPDLDVIASTIPTASTEPY